MKTIISQAALEAGEPGPFGFSDIRVLDGGLAPRYMQGEVALVESGVPPTIGQDVFLRMRDGGEAIAHLVAVEGDALLFGDVNDHRRAAYVQQGDIETMERITGRISPPPSFESHASDEDAQPTLH